MYRWAAVGLRYVSRALLTLRDEDMAAGFREADIDNHYENEYNRMLRENPNLALFITPYGRNYLDRKAIEEYVWKAEFVD